jgi:hypothetical protein
VCVIARTLFLFLHVVKCVCVCVFVRWRERERECVYVSNSVQFIRVSERGILQCQVKYRVQVDVNYKINFAKRNCL